MLNVDHQSVGYHQSVGHAPVVQILSDNSSAQLPNCPIFLGCPILHRFCIVFCSKPQEKWGISKSWKNAVISTKYCQKQLQICVLGLILQNFRLRQACNRFKVDNSQPDCRNFITILQLLDHNFVHVTNGASRWDMYEGTHCRDGEFWN